MWLKLQPVIEFPIAYAVASIDIHSRMLSMYGGSYAEKSNFLKFEHGSRQHSGVCTISPAIDGRRPQEVQGTENMPMN